MVNLSTTSFQSGVALRLPPQSKIFHLENEPYDILSERSIGCHFLPGLYVTRKAAKTDYTESCIHTRYSSSRTQTS